MFFCIVSGVKTEMLTRFIIFVITFFTLSCHLTTTEENQALHPKENQAVHPTDGEADGPPPADAARVADESGVQQVVTVENEMKGESQAVTNENPIAGSDDSEQLDSEEAELEHLIQSELQGETEELDGAVEEVTAEYYEENIGKVESPEVPDEKTVVESDTVEVLESMIEELNKYVSDTGEDEESEPPSIPNSNKDFQSQSDDTVDRDFPNPFSNDLLHSPKVAKILRHRPVKDVLETTVIYKPDQYGRVKMEQYIQTKVNGRIVLDYQEHYETHPERVTHKDVLDAHEEVTMGEDSEDPEIIDFGNHPDGRPLELHISTRSRLKGETEEEEEEKEGEDKVESEDELQNKPMTEEEKKGKP